MEKVHNPIRKDKIVTPAFAGEGRSHCMLIIALNNL